MDGEEDAADLGNLLTVLEPVRENSKRKSRWLRDRFIASRSVRQDTGKIGDLADPSTVLFAFNLDREIAHVHRCYDAVVAVQKSSERNVNSVFA